MAIAMAKRLMRRLGFDVVRYREKPLFPPDFDQESADIVKRVMPYTMTSPERVFALIQAVKYAVAAKIPDSIVECGVWRWRIRSRRWG